MGTANFIVALDNYIDDPCSRYVIAKSYAEYLQSWFLIVFWISVSLYGLTFPVVLEKYPMKHLYRLIVILIVVVLTAGAIAAPVHADASKTTVSVAFVEGEPGTLDPQVAETINEFLVLRNVYEGLVSYDPHTLQPTPALAESWDISKDLKVYTFHLRQGVKFHNGRAVTAQDVKFSLERLANPETGKSYTTFLLDSVKGIDAVRKGTAKEVEGLKVLDDKTFEITLSNPVASFLNQLTLPGAFVVPQEATTQADFNSNPVGTGPYKFVQWVRRKQVTLEANTDYWGGAPKVPYIALKVIPNSLQQISDFKAGKVDITLVPPFELQKMQSDTTLSGQLQEVPPLAVSYLIINLHDPILSKVEVRKALNMAIDRDGLLTGVLKGQGHAAEGMYPALLSAYDDSHPFPHDAAAVKDLLTKAGYGNGFDLSVNLATDETDKRVMGVIQTQLAEFGITLTVNSTDKNTYDTLRKVCEGQLFVSTWTGDYADPDNFAVLLTDTSAMRQSCGYGQYEGVDEVKSLMAQASAMLPGADRDAVYRKAQKIAMDQAISIPIYFRSQSALISTTLDGAFVDATLGINFANISFK
jgi:peptide/nickel transport system substrate-binding protein/oligopeptide transport system substrate-binding protein